jgi:hypothetical protein
MANQPNSNHLQPSPTQGAEGTAPPVLGAVQTTISILEAAKLHRESVRQSLEEQKASLNKIIQEQKISSTRPFNNMRTSMATAGIAAPSVVPLPMVPQNQETITPGAPPSQQSLTSQQPIPPQPPPIAPDHVWTTTEKLVAPFYKLLVMQLDANKRPDVAEEAVAMQQFVDSLKQFIAEEVHSQLQAMNARGGVVSMDPSPPTGRAKKGTRRTGQRLSGKKSPSVGGHGC